MKQITTYDNKTIDLTDEQYENLMTASVTGSAKGVWIAGTYVGFGNIKSIGESTSHDYHQPYTDQKSLPGAGFTGVIRGSDERGLVGMMNGLKDYITASQYDGATTQNSEKLLARMEQRYRLIMEVDHNEKAYHEIN